jgi:cyclohexa-1,5-dienecarbonyl-CoA hydratase
MSASPLRVSHERDGQLLHLQLNRPKANIFDARMIGALQNALTEHLGNTGLKAVLLSARGPHFSFGASVEEHLPEQCGDMLRSLHQLIRCLVGSPVPILVAVRGQCLGGALEIAAAGHLIFAAADAKMGQPEIKLGVFAPAASCLLPMRIGQARAEDLLLSGRSIDAEEAYRFGLVTSIDDDPEGAALAYFEQHLEALSASTLRLAVTAVRGDMQPAVHRRLAEVETLYLEQLMKTRDAVAGLTAFIAGEPAVWEHR